MNSRRSLGMALAVVLLVTAATGCGKKKSKARAPQLPASGKPVAAGDVEYGYASWYGHPYHGRRTANGEVYDMNGISAAHKTLPFNTEVEVANLENGRKVRVRINDRGPFIDGRIIDLSLSAAKEIRLVGPGTAMVQVKVLTVGDNARYAVPPRVMAKGPGAAPASPAATAPPPVTAGGSRGAAAPVQTAQAPPAAAASRPAPAVGPAPPPGTLPLPDAGLDADLPADWPDEPPDPPSAWEEDIEPAAEFAAEPGAHGFAGFVVQVGAFADRNNAERLRREMARRYPGLRVVIASDAASRLHRVWVGSEPSQAQAVWLAEQLRQGGAAGFVVRAE
jgi:rare lipoprotein A